MVSTKCKRHLYAKYASVSHNHHNTSIALSLRKPHRRYPYFDVVAGLVWSKDPESYAGGSIATGRGSLAGQVKGDDPD
jgi:hypothetical protein